MRPFELERFERVCHNNFGIERVFGVVVVTVFGLRILKKKLITNEICVANFIPPVKGASQGSWETVQLRVPDFV